MAPEIADYCTRFWRRLKVQKLNRTVKSFPTIKER